MTSAEESSSVSEDEGVISLETRARFGEALEKIQRGDASIYDPNTEDFFETASSESELEEEQEEETPLYLKDVRSKQLLEFGAAAYGSSEEEAKEEDTQDPQRNAKRKREKFLYDEEQTKNRLDMVKALEEEMESDGLKEHEDEFGGLEKVERPGEEESSTDSETERKEGTVKKHLDSYFAHITDLKREDVEFLKEYIENEQWRVDKWGTVDDSEEEEMVIAQDEEYLEKAAKFEADYNFRFEEPGSHEIVSHPRQLDGTLRKKESKRKRQRANKAERKRQQKEMEEQEIKQQKNQKRKDIQHKLEELNAVCGGGVDADLLQKLLDSDNEFDIDEWDVKMEETFNEDYYKKEDSEFTLTAEERRLEDYSNGHSLEFKREEVENDEQEDALEESGYVHRQDLQRLMQEYYRLDREDTIDGLKCRYRYVKVPKEDYGLASHDILCLDDKKLNAYVGLRRLNPYREDQGQYKYHPGKLRKLLEEVDYTGRRLSSAAEAEENGTSDSRIREDEPHLDQKIKQETDPDVRGRLESYSHETLRPYQRKKHKERRSSQDMSRFEDTSKKAKLKQTSSEFEGMPKAQKKNIKRRMKKKEKMENTT